MKVSSVMIENQIDIQLMNNFGQQGMSSLNYHRPLEKIEKNRNIHLFKNMQTLLSDTLLVTYFRIQSVHSFARKGSGKKKMRRRNRRRNRSKPRGESGVMYSVFLTEIYFTLPNMLTDRSLDNV